MSLERILVIEDDPDIRAIVEMALTTVGGYTVKTCNGGAEALEVAPDFKPDLILLDVMMPGMDGPDTFRALRTLSQTAETPVVFLTAKAQLHEVEEYRKLGVANVIAKPFNPMSLPSIIERIWNANQAA